MDDWCTQSLTIHNWHWHPPVHPNRGRHHIITGPNWQMHSDCLKAGMRGDSGSERGERRHSGR
jgi:hypothetical protein